MTLGLMEFGTLRLLDLGTVRLWVCLILEPSGVVVFGAFAFRYFGIAGLRDCLSLGRVDLGTWRFVDLRALGFGGVYSLGL